MVSQIEMIDTDCLRQTKQSLEVMNHHLEGPGRKLCWSLAPLSQLLSITSSSSPSLNFCEQFFATIITQSSLYRSSSLDRISAKPSAFSTSFSLSNRNKKLLMSSHKWQINEIDAIKVSDCDNLIETTTIYDNEFNQNSIEYICIDDDDDNEIDRQQSDSSSQRLLDHSSSSFSPLSLRNQANIIQRHHHPNHHHQNHERNRKKFEKNSPIQTLSFGVLPLSDYYCRSSPPSLLSSSIKIYLILYLNLFVLVTNILSTNAYEAIYNLDRVIRENRQLNLQLPQQIDLIQSLRIRNSADLEWDPKFKALLLRNDHRSINFNRTVAKRITKLMARSDDVTILISFKQNQLNTGAIFSITDGIDRVIEIQSSSRKKELRFYYRFERRIYSETFQIPEIADNEWHRLSITISDSQLDLHFDCVHRFRRSIESPLRNSLELDKDLSRNNTSFESDDNKEDDSNLTLWLGQRGPKHFHFKGYLKDVRIIADANGLQMQCPSTLDTACPTCGQFRTLQHSFNDLENIVKRLIRQIRLMEQRLVNVESCECSKSCIINDTKHEDGSSWRNRCQICKCLSGKISCRPANDCEDTVSFNAIDSQMSTAKNNQIDAVIQASPLIPSLKNLIFAPNSASTNKTTTSLKIIKSKKCFYNKKLYDEGETYEKWINKNSPNRKCYECVCQSRSMRCKEKQCPKLDCPQEKWIQPDDRCCMICETDFCALGHRCHHNAECRNLATNYTCHCRPGFIGDGHTCADIDECSSIETNKCINSMCVNKPGSYECHCRSGFRPSPQNPFECVDIDECQSGQFNCTENSVCINQNGSYRCQCKFGYEFDGNTCRPICKDSCLNGGQCTEPNKCSCRKGYYGHRCEEDIDECAMSLHQCPKNSRCINKPGWYHCECQQGFEDKRLGVLMDQNDMNRFDLQCQDINECLDPLLNTCPSHSKCFNFEGGYRCECDHFVNASSSSLLNGNEYALINGQCPQTCIFNGMERRHGDQWLLDPNKDQCQQCQCSNGVVQCHRKHCDCSNHFDSLDSICCSQCQQNQKVCYHQKDHRIMFNGQRWSFECETCECINGEIDCWNECPEINCLNPIRVPGDCCLRCQDDPCQIDSKNSNSINNTGFSGCLHQNRHYRSGDFIRLNGIASKDKCTSCLCQNGRLCCSYRFGCLDDVQEDVGDNIKTLTIDGSDLEDGNRSDSNQRLLAFRATSSELSSSLKNLESGIPINYLRNFDTKNESDDNDVGGGDGLDRNHIEIVNDESRDRK
ncbi:dnaJ subfamily A member 1 [Sarcoptes scabiei]|nr:dnaJ subfamily A member 1 [Sarcoptes scabiei]